MYWRVECISLLLVALLFVGNTSVFAQQFIECSPPMQETGLAFPVLGPPYTARAVLQPKDKAELCLKFPPNHAIRALRCWRKIEPVELEKPTWRCESNRPCEGVEFGRGSIVMEGDVQRLCVPIQNASAFSMRVQIAVQSK
jgi:hypothetical protein